MNALKKCSDHEPNPNSSSTILDNVRDLMNIITDINSLVEDNSYHIPTQKPVEYLRRFMLSHGIYYAGESFKQRMPLLQGEIESI